MRRIMTTLLWLAKTDENSAIRLLAVDCLCRIQFSRVPSDFDVVMSDGVDEIVSTLEPLHPNLVAEVKILRFLPTLIHSQDVVVADAATTALSSVLFAVHPRLKSCIYQHVDTDVLRLAKETVVTANYDRDVSNVSVSIFDWAPADCSEIWIRRTTSDLLKACTATQLRACQNICSLYTPLARVLFPLAFAAVAADQPAALRAALAASIYNPAQYSHFPVDLMTLFARAFVATQRRSQNFVQAGRDFIVESLRAAKDLSSEPPHLSKRLKQVGFLWNSDPFWSDFEFAKASRVCLHGGSPFAALQIMELALEKNGMGTFDDSLMIDIFQGIGEPDSLRSLGSLCTGPAEAWRINSLLYSYEANWHHAISLFNQRLAIERCPSNRAALHKRIVEALIHDGQLNIADTYLHGLSLREPSALEDPQVGNSRAQLSWKLRQWIEATTPSTSRSTDQVILSVLALQSKGAKDELATAVACLQSILLERLSNLHFSRSEDVLRVLVEIQQHKSIHDYVGILSGTAAQVRELSKRWAKAIQDLGRNIEIHEPLAALRYILQDQMEGNRPTTTLKLSKLRAEAFRDGGRFHLAELALADMNSSLSKLMGTERAKYIIHSVPCRLEEARFSWARSEKTQAIQKLKKLITYCRSDKDFLEMQQRLKSLPSAEPLAAELNDALATMQVCAGTWFAEAKMEGSTATQRYLEEAVALFAESRDPSRGLFELSTFLDTRWASLLEEERSAEHAAAKQLREARNRDFQAAKVQIEKTPSSDARAIQTFHKLHRMVERDHLDEENASRAQQLLLQQMFDAWLKVLKSPRLSQKHIIHAAFRVISIWFSSYLETPTFSKSLRDCVDKLQTDRFLTLFYQIASRLSAKMLHGATTNAATFQSTLVLLIKTIVMQHPQQTLPTLYSMSHSNIVKDSHSKHYVHDTDKMQAAANVWKEMVVADQSLKEVADQTMSLLDAYVELAFQDQSKSPLSDTPHCKSLPSKLSTLRHLTQYVLAI